MDAPRSMVALAALNGNELTWEIVHTSPSLTGCAEAAIAHCSMDRVAPFGLLLPVFALISSVLFLGDRMTPKLIVGGLLAISGVAITQVRPPARPIWS
jgi:uncharacterized membrane protein